MKPDKSPDSDGFITVRYKSKKNRNCRKPTSLETKFWQLQVEAKGEVFDKDKFNSIIEDLKISNLFINFKEHLLCTLENHYSNVGTNCPENLTQNKRLDIVCYGLGPFISCRQAKYQLAFLIMLKDIVAPTDISIYDPLFSESEKNVLEDFGINVLDVNEEGKRTVCNGTVFFMPRCELFLYNNLLWANWSKDSLLKVIIIGNSLKQYSFYRPERILKELAPHVNYASKFVTEIEIINDFKFLDIFNNMSLQYFHENALCKVPFEVWNDNVEPVYDSDGKIIKNVC